MEAELFHGTGGQTWRSCKSLFPFLRKCTKANEINTIFSKFNFTKSLHLFSYLLSKHYVPSIIPRISGLSIIHPTVTLFPVILIFYFNYNFYLILFYLFPVSRILSLKKMFEYLTKHKHWYRYVECNQNCSWRFLVIAFRNLYIMLKRIRSGGEDNLRIVIYTLLGHSRGIVKLGSLPTQSFTCKRYCFLHSETSMFHELVYTPIRVSIHIIFCDELMCCTWIHEIQQIVMDPWLVICRRKGFAVVAVFLMLYSGQSIFRYTLESKA